MILVERLIPESGTHQPRDISVPATLILHTNGASNSVGSLYEYILNSKTRIYPHVQVARGGTVEQYCPWDRQAFVQFDGNRYAFSAESQDSGYNNVPIDRDPWTNAQLRAFADLAVSLGVAAKACTSPTSGGIGHHSQFRDSWNKTGHNCPGFARRQQIPQVVDLMTQLVIADVPPPKEADMELIRDPRTGEIDVLVGRWRGPVVADSITDVPRRLAVAAEWEALLGKKARDVSADFWDSLLVAGSGSGGAFPTRVQIAATVGTLS